MKYQSQLYMINFSWKDETNTKEIYFQMHTREFMLVFNTTFSYKVNAPSLLCTGKENSVHPKLAAVGFTNSTHTWGQLISLPASSMAKESGGPCRLFLITILSTVFILIRGQNQLLSACYKSFSNLKENWLFIFMEESFKSHLPASWKQASLWIWCWLMKKTPVHLLGPSGLINSVPGWLFTHLNWLLQIVFKK